MTLETLQTARLISSEMNDLDHVIKTTRESLEKDDPIGAIGNLSWYWREKKDEVNDSIKRIVGTMIEEAEKRKVELIKQLEAL